MCVRVCVCVRTCVHVWDGGGSFKEYVVKDLGKNDAKALAVTLGIGYVKAKRMLHGRTQYEKDGRLHELSSSVMAIRF